MGKENRLKRGTCACGAPAPFVDYDRCAECLGVQILGRNDSEQIVQQWSNQAEAQFQALISGPLHPTDLLGALLIAESFEQRKRPDLIILQDRPWAILAMLNRRPLTSTRSVAYSGAFIKNATLALEMALLNQLKYDVPAGLVRLVRAKQPQTEEFPTVTYGPEIPLRMRDAAWMNATRIPFGQIPGTVREAEEIEPWFTGDDAGGSYLALLKRYDLSIAPIFANFQRQFYKSWAPGVIQSLSSMKPARVRSLVDLLNFLEGNGRTKTLDGDKDAEHPFREVEVGDVFRAITRLQDPTVLTDLLLGAGTAPTFPLLVNHSPSYGVPSLLARHYRLIAGGYLVDASGRQHIQNAGDQFERLVARLLADQGWITTVEDAELVGVFRTKKHMPDEIDVIAIDEDRVALIECKAEIDPPGAWNPLNIKNRKQELSRYASKLYEKSCRWEAHLCARKQVRVGGKLRDLPIDGPDVKVRAGIISIRIEPIYQGTLPVATLWPSKAASFAEAGFPQGLTCPIVGHESLSDDIDIWFTGE